MCWHWECPSCPPSPLLNPRRSTVWRTPWRLWKTTTKSPSASTPPLRRTCRRTWCLRNTICSGFRNSWPWLRRYDIITVVHTHRGQSPRESVLCLFLLCRVCLGAGEEVPGDCCLSQHEGDPDQEERSDQRPKETIAEVRMEWWKFFALDQTKK